MDGPDDLDDRDDPGRTLSVAALVAALRSHDPATRAQALDRVSALGTAVIPTLLAALKVEHDTQGRINLGKALARRSVATRRRRYPKCSLKLMLTPWLTGPTEPTEPTWA
ncbi:MAG: HEAT repeat domain-containing protein [Ktedonobacterales bacterium]